MFLLSTQKIVFVEKQEIQFFKYTLLSRDMDYSKTSVKRPLSKRPKIGFQDQLSLNASQKYCRMLQVEHSAIILTFIKLPFVIKIFVLSNFEWPFYTGFTVVPKPHVLAYLTSNLPLIRRSQSVS